MHFVCVHLMGFYLNTKNGLSSRQWNRNHNCGCAILTNKWILTAGNCIKGFLLFTLGVLVGTNDLKNGGTYYNLDKAYVHEHYEQPPFANDVAVARVLETIAFNDRVQPIALSSEEVPDGAEVLLTGWGRLSVSTLSVNYINPFVCDFELN